MPRNLTRTLRRADILALESLRTECHRREREIVDRVYADTPGREAIHHLIAGTHAKYTELAAKYAIASSSVSSAWHRQQMPPLMQMRRLLYAHRLITLMATNRCSLNYACTVLGLGQTYIQRTLGPHIKGRVANWLTNTTPAMAQLNLERFLANYAVNVAAFTPPRPLTPIDALQVRSLRKAERRLETQLARVRIALEAAYTARATPSIDQAA